jgi:hypothetical protein
VELFAERGPDIVPNGGVRDAIMNENDGVCSSSALFVVELPCFNLDKCPRC